MVWTSGVFKAPQDSDVQPELSSVWLKGLILGRHLHTLFPHLSKPVVQEATCPRMALSLLFSNPPAEKDPNIYMIILKGILKGVLQQVESKGEHVIPPATHQC